MALPGSALWELLAGDDGNDPRAIAARAVRPLAAPQSIADLLASAVRGGEALPRPGGVSPAGPARLPLGALPGSGLIALLADHGLPTPGGVLDDERALLARVAADPTENPMKRRLAEHLAWVAPKDVLDVPHAALRGGAGMLGLLLEGSNAAQEIGGGGIMAGLGQAMKPIGPDESPGLIELLTRTAARGVGQALHIDQASLAANEAFDRAQAGGGGPVGATRSAYRAGSDKSPVFATLAGMPYDPLNLLGPVGKGLEATKLARLGRILVAADDIQNLPFEALGKLARPALRAAERTGAGRRVSAASRLAARRLARIMGEADPLLIPPPSTARALQSSLPDPLLAPPVRRGPTLTPELPPTGLARPSFDDNTRALLGRAVDEAADPSLPTLFAPELPRRGPIIDPARRTVQPAPDILSLLHDVPPRRTIPARDILPLEAVTPAQERAAGRFDWLADTPPDYSKVGEFPSYGFSSRAEALAELGGDDYDTLLGLAYPTDAAMGNAIAKYSHPVDLADAAIARIGADPHLLARLSATDDGLARKLAYLPDPEPASARATARATADVGGGMPHTADDLARLRDDEAMLDQIRLQVIEEGPFAEAFKYFNPDGGLRKVNPITGKRINVREGGKFAQGRAEVWNLEGTGYDQVASNILDNYRGDHNQNFGMSAEEFWSEAREAFLEHRALSRPHPSTGAAGGQGVGLLGYPGGINGPVGRAILPAVGGSLAGGLAGGAYGATQGDTPGQRLSNALKYATLGGGAGFAAGGAGSMVNLSPELRHLARSAGAGAATNALAYGTMAGGVGALHGLTQGNTWQERFSNALDGGIRGALGGAVAGAATGIPSGLMVGHNTSEQALRQGFATAHELAGQAQARSVARGKTQRFLGQTDQGRGGVGTAIAQTWRVAKADMIQHPKNWQNDELFGTVVTRLQQGGDALAEVKPIRDELVARMKVTDPYKAQPIQTQDRLAAIGRGGHVADLGTPLASAEAGLADTLSAAQTMQASALASLLNPTGPNALGVAFGAGKGRYAAYRDQFFRSINDVGNGSFRYAAFNDELDHGLAAAERRLQAQYPQVGGMLPQGGQYSPAQVRKVAGQQAGDLWDTYVDAAVIQAEDRARFLFGDYNDKGPVEKAFSGVVPFASWAIRAYPVAVQMAIEHPAVALGVYHLLRAASAGAGQGGRPGYTAGMIGIPTDTPLVGPLVSALTGGQQGIAYVDPIGAISPVGGEPFAPAPEGDRTWYQQATDVLGRTGLPQPNPAIRAAAFATGLDYQEPGAITRTAGIENALGLIPGNPDLPNVADTTMRGLRAGLSPAIGPAIGGEADPYPAPFEASVRRYSELVLSTTGKPLDDPSNRKYLLMLGDANNPLWQQAEVETRAGGGARNAYGFVSPVGAVAVGEDSRANREAKQGEPYTYDEIQAAKQTDPAKAKRMQAAVDTYDRTHPGAAAYHITSREEAEATLIASYAARYRSQGFTAARARELAAQAIERDRERLRNGR